jgi:NRAMP (natural resistance-associated macrophage protein)-like metal ion transporter
MGRFADFRRRSLIFLSVMGPGIITANVDNDAGGITTYSIAGSKFGYLLLWSMLPISIMLIVVQEMVNRMGIVTGKGLSDLIREKFGVRATFYLMLGILITNFGNIMAEFAGIAAASELFDLSRYLAVPLAGVAVWILVLKGTYRTVEKVFLAACLFYVAYFFTAFLARPDWGQVGKSLIVPAVGSDPPAALIMLIGLVGTTIAPWMQFYQQAAVAEKGIRLKDFKWSRLDTIAGGITVCVVAAAIVISCAATLHVSGVTEISSAEDAAKALKPLAKGGASLLFGIGLLNASLFAASILPLSTAFSVCEGLGWETGVNKQFVQAPQFYTLYSLLIAGGAGLVLLPGLHLVRIMYISQVVNGLVLPVVLLYILVLANDPKVMGNYRNGLFGNAVAIITCLSVAALTLMSGLTFLF